MAHRLSTVVSGDHAAPERLGGLVGPVPRSLRLPRAMLLGLTIVYLAVGEFFVIRLADRSETTASDLLISRAQSIVAGLDRAAESLSAFFMPDRRNGGGPE